MANVRLQQNSATPASGSFLVTLPTITAGSLVVAGLLSNNNVTISTATDTAGNSYTTAVGPFLKTGVGTLWLIYKENATGIGSTNTLTVSFSAASGGGEIAIAEYSGVTTSTSLDQHPVGASGTTGTAITSTSFNPGTAGELVVAFIGDDGSGGSPTAGTGYSNVVQPDTFTLMMEKLSASTGSQTAGATQTSTPWAIVAASWLTAAGGVVTPNRRTLMGTGI